MLTAEERLQREKDEAEKWLKEHEDEPGELPGRRLTSGESSQPEKSNWLSRTRNYPLDLDRFDGFEEFEKHLAPHGFNKSKTLEQRRLSAQMEYCWQFLSAQDQELLTMRFYEQLPLKEIGRRLRCSYQAVQGRLRTAGQNLKRAIAEHGDEIVEVDDAEI